MRIGVPREIKTNENRVALRPAGAEILVKDGHEVRVERTAGEGSGYADRAYEEAGARIVDGPDEVFAESDMILKVKEPLPAEDIDGHAELAAVAAMPIAVGESLYHLSHFREYLQRRACSIVQVDCARTGGITPWLKVAHVAESFNVAVCPHFLMELHVSLTAAVPNGAWVEYIPQLDSITTSRLTIDDGYAVPPATPGLGIEWDFSAIDRTAVARATL